MEFETSRNSTVELDETIFPDSQMNLPIVMSSAEQKSLLLKINCEVIASIKVSNFNELWFAIRNDGKILTCWCCNREIPCLYEKECTNM